MRTRWNIKKPHSKKRKPHPDGLTRTGQSRTQQTYRSKRITKLDKCLDRQFISPIVITVKKDQTIKMALDSKKIGKTVHKDEYQMANIDLLLENIA